MIALLAATVLVATSSGPASPAALQTQAAIRLGVIVEETFADIARHVNDGVPISEADVRANVVKAFAREGLTGREPPILAVGPHSSDPTYDAASDEPIKRGDFLLLQIAAKKDAPGALYGDVTWVAYVGPTRSVPPRIQKVWGIVRESRDRAITELKSKAKSKPTGEQIDWFARTVIEKNRLGPWFPHATGHSLGEADLGDGPNLRRGDTRVLAEGQCFTVEPGVYYPAEFGVRSGVDVCLTPKGAEVTSGVAQREIRALLE